MTTKKAVGDDPEHPDLLFVKNALAKNPELSINHFVRRCGIGKVHLDAWVAHGWIAIVAGQQGVRSNTYGRKGGSRGL